MMQTQIDQLRREERRLLRRFDGHAEVLMSENRKMTVERARIEAMIAMPNCSKKYAYVRSALTSLRQRPMTFEEAGQ
jgi:hypothetical protein